MIDKNAFLCPNFPSSPTDFFVSWMFQNVLCPLIKWADNPCFRHADEYASASFVQKWNSPAFVTCLGSSLHFWRLYKITLQQNILALRICRRAWGDEPTSQAWALKRKRRSFGVTVQMWTSTGLLSWILSAALGTVSHSLLFDFNYQKVKLQKGSSKILV